MAVMDDTTHRHKIFPTLHLSVDGAGEWWVANVRVGTDGGCKSAWRFVDHGLSVYVPLKRHIVRHARSTREVERPLFPGIAFVAGNAGDIATARDVELSRREYRCVFAWLEARDQRRIIFELQNLKSSCDAQKTGRIRSELSRGTRVRISKGRLEGLEGRVEVAEPDVIWLNVSMLGQSCEMKVDDPSSIEIVE